MSRPPRCALHRIVPPCCSHNLVCRQQSPRPELSGARRESLLEDAFEIFRCNALSRYRPAGSLPTARATDAVHAKRAAFGIERMAFKPRFRSTWCRRLRIAKIAADVAVLFDDDRDPVCRAMGRRKPGERVDHVSGVDLAIIPTAASAANAARCSPSQKVFAGPPASVASTRESPPTTPRHLAASSAKSSSEASGLRTSCASYARQLRPAIAGELSRRAPFRARGLCPPALRAFVRPLPAAARTSFAANRQHWRMRQRPRQARPSGADCGVRGRIEPAGLPASGIRFRISLSGNICLLLCIKRASRSLRGLERTSEIN